MDDITAEVGFGANEDILPYTESKEIITYSNAIDIVLSSACRNQCGFCHFSRRKADLVVPYSTIKLFKAARKMGAREANLISGERPDRYHVIRAKFDIWGFNSYAEYIYTIAELAFLEGLLVNLNVGYLSYNELKYLQEIVSTVEIPLENINKDFLQTSGIFAQAPSKDPEIRIKLLESAGKLNIPVLTSVLLGVGESPEDRIMTLVKIKELQEEYGNIQSVKINLAHTSPEWAGDPFPALGEEVLLETIRLARELLPEDVDITVPVNQYSNLIELIEHGVNDLGQIRNYDKDYLFPEKPYKTVGEYQQILEASGYRLFKRLPIKNSFIVSQKYSKKLGQFLDKYKMRLKETSKEDKFVLTL